MKDEFYLKLFPELAPETVTIVCEKCGAESLMERWPVIPRQILEEVTEAVEEGELFEFCCPECGCVELRMYWCLFDDFEANQLVLMVPEQEREEGVACLERKVGGERQCTGRLVFHPGQMSEKVRLMRDGLNDMAIELVKYFIQDTMMGEDPLYATLKLWYEGVTDQGDIVLSAYGWEDGEVLVERRLYDSYLLDVTFAEESLVEDFVVDQQWAHRFLSRPQSAESLLFGEGVWATDDE